MSDEVDDDEMVELTWDGVAWTGPVEVAIGKRDVILTIPRHTIMGTTADGSGVDVSLPLELLSWVLSHSAGPGDDVIAELAVALADEMEGLTPEGWAKQSDAFRQEFMDGAVAVIRFLRERGWRPSPPPGRPDHH